MVCTSVVGARERIGALVGGAGFGALTSLVNGLSSDYGLLGGWLRSSGATAWAAGPVRVLSLVLDSGWAWAGVAVLAGFLAATRLRAARDGAVVLVAATAAYFAADAGLRWESLADDGAEVLVWWAASVVLGPLLGLVGALAREPATTGLLAGLVVPVGLLTQMALLPPGWGGAEVRPSAVVARVLVSVAGLALAVGVVRRAAAEPRIPRSSAHGRTCADDQGMRD